MINKDLVTENAFYAQQIELPEVGRAGQQVLRQSKVLVVGAGGLGSPVLMYLAAAGVGEIGINDYDKVEISNLHRQVIYQVSDLGKEKSLVAAQRIALINPFVIVHTYPYKLDGKQLKEIVATYDLVIDCTDNYSSKFHLNDVCVALAKPLVQASIYRWEGHILAFLPNAPGGCLRCVWPQPPKENCTGNCGQTGVIGVVPGVMGALQASEALKILLNLPSLLSDNLLIFNLISLETKTIKRQKACLTCKSKTLPLNSTQINKKSSVDLDVSNYSQDQLAEYIIIDIREMIEIEESPVPCHLVMPLSQFDLSKLNSKKKYLLFCQHGIRSSALVNILREEGFEHVFSAAGGAEVLLMKNLPLSCKQEAQ